MAPLTRPRLPLRLVPVAALLLALIVAVGPVAAANPTVTANPALVPFSETPGQPGVTTLTFTAGGTPGLNACGQDNAAPPFTLGPVAPTTPLTLNFPFIQAGKYTFWVSTDPACAVGNKFTVGATVVQATATRVGPTGLAGKDDIDIRVPPGGSIVDQTTGAREIILSGLVTDSVMPKTQKFPIPDTQLCIMSGDGAQVTIKMQVGQDGRPQGLGAAAVSTTITPFAGQNGCVALPWIVNGGYVAQITRSGGVRSIGFCVDITSGGVTNTPSNAPTAAGIGKCAQVATFPDPAKLLSPLAPATVVNGSIVTGADAHAVQVCVSAFSRVAPGGAPFRELANTVNAYNGSGAVNLTPLTLNFPSGTTIKITTYDITGPGPGGTGGAQFACPPTTAIQVTDQQVVLISAPSVPNTTIIDTRNYLIGA